LQGVEVSIPRTFIFIKRLAKSIAHGA